MLVGKEEESLVVLTRLRNQHQDSSEVQYEYRSLKVEAYADRETARIRYGTEEKNWRTEMLEYKRIFTTKVLLHRVGLGAGVQAFGQWAGESSKSTQSQKSVLIANFTRNQRNYLLCSHDLWRSRSLGRKH